MYVGWYMWSSICDYTHTLIITTRFNAPHHKYHMYLYIVQSLCNNNHIMQVDIFFSYIHNILWFLVSMDFVQWFQLQLLQEVYNYFHISIIHTYILTHTIIDIHLYRYILEYLLVYLLYELVSLLFTFGWSKNVWEN